MENQKKTITILVFAMLFIIVFTLAFYYYGQSKLTYTYKGKDGDYLFHIVSKGGVTSQVIRVFVNNKDEYYYPLRYGPQEVASLQSDENLKETLLGKSGNFKKTLYITQDPDLANQTDSQSILSVVEINRVTGTADYGVFKIPTLTAITRETERSKELALPFVTCANVTSSVGVLWLKLGDANRVYSDQGCVIIEAKNGEDILKLSDRFVYTLLGVFS